MNVWLVLIACGALTYAIRLSFLISSDRYTLSGLLERSLRFVPISVLTALIVPDLLLRGNELMLSLQNDRLLAGIVAVVVAWRTRNTLLTIAVGMAVLLVLQQF